MPQSTSLKIPPKLKARIGPLARRSGKTPHAWMVEALEQQAELAELREGFLRDAENAAEEIDGGGPVYSADDVHAYILARAAGKRPRKPRALPRPHRR